MRDFLIILVVAVLVALGVYFIFKDSIDQFITEGPAVEQEAEQEAEEELTATSTEPSEPTPAPEEDEEPDERDRVESIGTSAGGNDLVAYHFGEGDRELLFVGGIHGGYSWNTALLGFELVDYFSEDAARVPEGVTVTVIPVLNPDGLATLVGEPGRFAASDIPEDADTVPGRFNDNGVDLNRNFDCEWESTGTWQDREVDGGSAPFSEPEAAAVRDYVGANEPAAVVVYYSAAGGVFASNCRNGVLPETTELVSAYADASGYQAYESFDFYEITGDMVNWLAKEDIPAISVLLSDHQTLEWQENRAGVEAVLEYVASERAEGTESGDASEV
ncbi:hypothetical protein GVX82_00325 [Patescibacteria group bacterium]|jgi:murein tripeptide amidase MpaA|nr:hypothetical protein [Patescibacteria group bacterium]